MPTGVDPITGKQKFKTFYGSGQAEAKTKRDEYLTAIRTGTYVEKTKTLFGDYILEWLDLYKKPKVKESTYSLYYSRIEVHIVPELGKIELQKIDTNTLQRFYNKKAGALSGSSISILHMLINGALKFAVKEKLILSNPDEFTERKKIKAKDVKPLNQKELQKFLEVAKEDQFYPLFLLDLHTGLRKGELLGLKWSDLDFSTGIICIERSVGRIQKVGEKGTKVVVSTPKTESGKRSFPLPAEMVQLLKSHKVIQDARKLALGQKRSKDDYIFDNGYGKPVEARWFLRRLKIILGKADLRQDIRIHTLRHTFGTMLSQSGENPRNLMELMGHADIRTTLQTYVHSGLEDKQRAVDKMAALIKG